MRSVWLLAWFAALGAAVSLAGAMETMSGWKALSGASYLIHGGSLADRQLPSNADRKISILLGGRPAKDVFDSIGPDLPQTCSDEAGDRNRNKKGISCSFTARDKGTKPGPYRCWIGIDLRTGDSVATVSC